MSPRLATPLLAACLPLLSCATPQPPPAASPASAPAAPVAAPAPAAPPVPAAAPVPAAKTASRILCHAGARQAVFAELGVPADERPVDVAIVEPYVYVLFDAARLLRIKLPAGSGSSAEVRMQIGRGEKWTAMDVDPRDGSLWIAGDHFVLHHASAQGQLSAVPLQRVAGDGGFTQLVAAPDALYAVPVCAPEGVWRIDRQGRIAGTAFPYDPAQDSELAPGEEVGRTRVPGRLTVLGRCVRLLLMHGRGGTILARDFRGAVHQADAEGRWRPVLDPIFRAPGGGALTGVDLGQASERWYFNGPGGQLFFWKDRPVFLAGGTLNARIDVRRPRERPADTVLVVPGGAGGGGFHELLEDCQGQNLLRVATTAQRYAAITPQRLVYGELATAPDLP